MKPYKIADRLKKPGKRLGKLPPKAMPNAPRLVNYMPRIVPAVAPEVSWVTRLNASLGGDWPYFLNDELGDCTIAAALHMQMQWSFYAGNSVPMFTDSDALVAYEAVGGYEPGRPSTDNGCYMGDVLQYWKNNGIGGNKIVAWAAVDFSNLDEVRWAIQTFGNVYTGLALPLSAQQGNWVVGDGGIYTPDDQPGGWGGHCIPMMGQSPLSITFPTWNELLKMSHNFAKDYVDEMYVCISKEWIGMGGVTASGLNLKQLEADLKLL